MVIVPDGHTPEAEKGPFSIDNRTTYSEYSANIRKNVNAKAAVSEESLTQIRAAVNSGEDVIQRGADEIQVEGNRMALENLRDDEAIDEISREIERERALLLLERETSIRDEFAASTAAGQPLDTSLFPTLPPLQLPSSNLPASITGSSGYTRNSALSPEAISDRTTGFNTDLRDGNVTPPGGLFASMPKDISLSEEDIQTLASSTTVTGKVLNFMSDPVGLSDTHRSYIGLTQVSVSPGTRTRKDYFCEVQVAVEYSREDPNCPGQYESSFDIGSTQEYPAVFAAFPLARAQIMDLQYSARDEFEIAVDAARKLASAGKVVNANLLLKQAKRLQNDVASRNALPVVVPSSTGHTITYRFQPSLMALSDPTRKNSKPGWVMNPISIPVMVVIISEKDEVAVWDHVRVSISTRWVPIEERHWVNKVATDWWMFPQRPGAKYNNVERMDLAYEFDSILCNQKYREVFDSVADLKISSEIRGRYLSLSSLVGSAGRFQRLPVPRPVILDVFPKEFTKEDLAVGLTILGEDLAAAGPGTSGYNRGNTKAYFNGLPLTVGRYLDGGKSIFARFDGDAVPFPPLDTDSEIRVETEGGISLPFKVSLKQTAKKAETPPAASTPSLSSVQPTRGFLNQGTYLAVSGTNLKSSKITQVAVAGRNCEFKVIGETGLVAVVPPWSDGVIHSDRQTVKGTLSIVSEGGVAHLATEIVFSADEADLFATLPSEAELTSEQKKLLKVTEAYKIIGEIGREQGDSLNSVFRMEVNSSAQEQAGGEGEGAAAD